MNLRVVFGFPPHNEENGPGAKISFSGPVTLRDQFYHKKNKKVLEIGKKTLRTKQCF